LTENVGGGRCGWVDGRRYDLSARRHRCPGHVARRRSSSPPPYKPEVDPRRVGVGQLRQQTSVHERQAVSVRRVVEMTTTTTAAGRRRRTVVTGDHAHREVDTGGTAASSNADR